MWVERSAEVWYGTRSYIAGQYAAMSASFRGTHIDLQPVKPAFFAPGRRVLYRHVYSRKALKAAKTQCIVDCLHRLCMLEGMVSLSFRREIMWLRPTSSALTRLYDALESSGNASDGILGSSSLSSVRKASVNPPNVAVSLISCIPWCSTSKHSLVVVAKMAYLQLIAFLDEQPDIAIEDLVLLSKET